MDETIHEINIRSGQPVTFGLPKTCPVARLVASIPSVGELLSLGKMEESGAWRVVGRSGGEEGRGEAGDSVYTGVRVITPTSPIHSPRSRSVALTLTVNATQ